MKLKSIQVLFFAIVLISMVACKTYNYNVNYTNGPSLIYNPLTNNHDFIIRGGIRSAADKAVFYPVFYSTLIPADIKDWYSIGENEIFCYPSKEFIVIHSPNLVRQPEQIGDFIKTEINKENIRDLYQSVESSGIYNQKKETRYKLKPGRINAIYDNGVTRIFLHNVKEKNEKEFLKTVQKFKYNWIGFNDNKNSNN